MGTRCVAGKRHALSSLLFSPAPPPPRIIRKGFCLRFISTARRITKGPSWGYPSPVLGTIAPFLSTFGENRPRFLKTLSKLTFEHPHEGPCVVTAPKGRCGHTPERAVRERLIRIAHPACRLEISRPTRVIDFRRVGQREREFFIGNLLVRIHSIIVMMRWTGLAPWEFELPLPGSLTSTFQIET